MNLENINNILKDLTLDELIVLKENVMAEIKTKKPKSKKTLSTANFDWNKTIETLTNNVKCPHYHTQKNSNITSGDICEDCGEEL